MENYKVLCITRHSLRGPLGFFNSQEIDLPNDIKFPNPFLTWNQNLEKDAYKLIHIESINQCVEFGLESIGIPNFNKNWNEIRCDFLAQRCFETGRILKEKIGNSKLKLTAVINKKEPNELFTYSNSNIDAVTYNIAPGAFPIMPPSTPTSVNPEIFYLLTANLLNYLNLALKNKNFTGKLPPEIINGEVTSFYKNNINITNDLITMSALTISPLNKLFKTNKKINYQEEVLKAACLWNQYYFYNQYPKQFTVYKSLGMIEYFYKMNYGDNKILLGHDDMQLCLMRSLKIAPYKYDIPFQSYIIIQSKKNVCIVYTAAKINPDGTFSTKCFVKKILWKGTIQEWDYKIKDMYSYVSDLYPTYPVKNAYELLIT